MQTCITIYLRDHTQARKTAIESVNAYHALKAERDGGPKPLPIDPEKTWWLDDESNRDHMISVREIECEEALDKKDYALALTAGQVAADLRTYRAHCRTLAQS